MKRKDYSKEAMRKIAEIGKAKEVELASEVIELGTYQDLQKKFKSIQGEIKGVEKSARQAANMADKATSGTSKSLGELKEIQAGYKDLLKDFKRLGIDVPSALSSAMAQVEAYASELRELDRALEKASDMIFGILQ